MLRIDNLPLPLDYDDQALLSLAARKLKLPEKGIISATLVKKVRGRP